MSVVALDSARPLLGGSTIAAACGVDPYMSPIRLWLELTGRVERAETEAMRWGKRLQPAIFAELQARGYGAHQTDDELRDPALPWLVGHPDGYDYTGDAARLTIVEAKAIGYPRDTLSPAHEAQAQTYMMLAGCDFGYVAQLSGLHLQVFELERKPQVVATLLGLAEAFVGYVRSDTQPPPSGHPDDRDALLLAHPRGGGTARETRAVRDARRELARLLEQEKAVKARAEHLRAVITDHMGDAETLISSHDEPVARWSNVQTRRLDTKRLRDQRPDIYDLYSTETEGRRLTLT